MGWFFSLICFILACLSSDSVLMVASAIFALAGEIDFKKFGK